MILSLVNKEYTKMSAVTTRDGKLVQGSPLLYKLFNDTRAAWLWLPLRIWLGWQWLDAGIHKVSNPAWMETGAALKGFWTGAVAIPEAPARPAIAFDWYRSFLQALLDAQAYTWFAKLVVIGELLVGIALILGAFVGFAAFFSGLMNWNFMMAGSASTNPLLFTIAVGIILAWKVAGYLGADFFLLRWIGTPWSRPDNTVGTIAGPQPVSEGNYAPAD
jgi:thiosulfate dehydrogenase (quinone) large subunit